MRRRPRSSGNPPEATDGDQPWPAWATAPIEVVDPDPDWAEQGARLAQAMGDLLASWLVGPVEHVGSTAVPGLPAKPIIDLLAPVRSLDDARAASRGLRVAGWSLVPPDLDGRPWRRLYVLPDGDRRLAHLHLVASDHPRVARTVLFRDRLRADPDLAEAYGRLKRDAAAAHRDDREAYTRAKTAFIDEVVRP